MAVTENAVLAPGLSVLGGASAGLSYEGALHDAGAAADRDRRRAAGLRRPMPPRQTQAAAPCPPDAACRALHPASQ